MGKHRAIALEPKKKADPKMGRLDNNPEGLLLTASFVQHAQSTLVSFVSSLLCFLSSSQSFISFTVSFVCTSLGASCCVFGSSQTCFGFFRCAAATGSQNCGQGQSREFQNVVHRVPLQGHSISDCLPRLRS
ncbi:hypothetical protein EMIT0P228_180029 [Pseudomonas brassicacearum]